MSDRDPGAVRERDVGDLRPRPDPTELTQSLVTIAKEDLRKEIGQRLDALEQLMDEKFTGVSSRLEDREKLQVDQFAHFDQRLVQAEKLRLELKADNEKNIEKALSGVEKANEKLETAITRTLIQMAETSKADTAGLRRDIDGLKDRLNDNKADISSVVHQRLGAKEDRSGLYATLGAVAGLVFLGIAIAAFLAR